MKDLYEMLCEVEKSVAETNNAILKLMIRLDRHEQDCEICRNKVEHFIEEHESKEITSR